MNVKLSKRLEKKFKTYVISKHGKLKGALAEEAENALNHYISCPNVKIKKKEKKSIDTLKAINELMQMD